MDWTILFYFLIPFAIFFAWGLLWRKARRRRKQMDSEKSEPIDYVALQEADLAASTEPSLYEQYSANRVAVGKFTTLRGFTNADMDNIVSQLTNSDIDAKYLFIETMPVGAITAIGAAGYFQIWVRQRDVKQTEEFLARYFAQS
jgi:hypothetical protein